MVQTSQLIGTLLHFDARGPDASGRGSLGRNATTASRAEKSPFFAIREFESYGLWIFWSPIPLTASTTPVLSIKAPPHPALKMDLPGMTPFSFVLPLAPNTMAGLAIGKFDGANETISVDTARSFNQQYVGQFSFIEPIRHLITGREGLIEAQQNGAGFSTRLSFHVASTVDFRGVGLRPAKSR